MIVIQNHVIVMNDIWKYGKHIIIFVNFIFLKNYRFYIFVLNKITIASDIQRVRNISLQNQKLGKF